MPGRTVRLTVWGRVSPPSAELAEPATAADAAEVLSARGPAARRTAVRQLAKDSRVPPEVYLRLPEFRKLRGELDPAGVLASDLSRRLGL